MENKKIHTYRKYAHALFLNSRYIYENGGAEQHEIKSDVAPEETEQTTSTPGEQRDEIKDKGTEARKAHESALVNLGKVGGAVELQKEKLTLTQKVEKILNDFDWPILALQQKITDVEKDSSRYKKLEKAHEAITKKKLKPGEAPLPGTMLFNVYDKLWRSKICTKDPKNPKETVRKLQIEITNKPGNFAKIIKALTDFSVIAINVYNTVFDSGGQEEFEKAKQEE